MPSNTFPVLWIRALAAVATCLVATSASAQADRLKDVDSVLDRLEQRLLDQESDGLTFGEKLPPPSADAPPPTTTYKFEGKAKIEGRTAEQQGLREIAALVAELENQVDQFASNVQKTKQTILDEAGIDNFFSLEARLDDSDSAAISALTIKMDGFSVYELQEAAGLWMPSKMIPLYAGPLQPGRHRIDLEARMVMKSGKSIPLNGDVYRFVNKSFDIEIPGGTSSQRYVIAITPPAKLDGVADAVMKKAL